MRTSFRLLLVVTLTVIALAGCYGSVGISVPIRGGYGGGPYGSVSIGTGPIWF
ncbi:MAG: hypothetical protein ACREOU_02410 [Candidatus Eiseniibacteriota bacterium]